MINMRELIKDEVKYSNGRLLSSCFESFDLFGCFFTWLFVYFKFVFFICVCGRACLLACVRECMCACMLAYLFACVPACVCVRVVCMCVRSCTRARVYGLSTIPLRYPKHFAHKDKYYRTMNNCIRSIIYNSFINLN